MNPRALIAAIRDGAAPPAADIRAFAVGLADGTVSDAQAGAFAMAVLLRGLDEEGRVALTEAMRDSGDVLRWDMPGAVVDKHSTGGVGDCVSLVLAPMLAACGAYVPMISGRGLGHSGGTLDKLEAIPGYRTDLDEPALRQVVGQVGCAIVGATQRIAPADRRLYAIRDVTGTVESLDLITASILSKKLAAGLEGLVMDVKLGTGAFMKDRAAAEGLAQALVSTASGAGCPTVALLTAMDEPLAPAMGNALEVRAALELLTGRAEHAPLAEVTLALGAEALMLGGLAASAAEARLRLRDSLTSGRAAERFGAMVAAQGGPPDFVDRWSDRLPGAAVRRHIAARETGFVAAMDGVALGEIVVSLGGGRRQAADRINPAVGLAEILRRGTPVEAGDPLAVIHAASEAAADAAEAAFLLAVTVAPAANPAVPPILGRVA